VLVSACPINSRRQTRLVAVALGVGGCEVDQMRSRNRECAVLAMRRPQVGKLICFWS